MKYPGLFLLLLCTAFYVRAFQAAKINDDEARRLVAAQPDFTADVACHNYQTFTGGGYDSTLKSVKKGERYIERSELYITYYGPQDAPVRYTINSGEYYELGGDVVNHIWFDYVSAPASLARDKGLKFEIVKAPQNIGDSPTEIKWIKIKVTGDRYIGIRTSLEDPVIYLYLDPDRKNLVVKWEVVFPKAGQSCSLGNVSFSVPGGLFSDFDAYRHRTDKRLALPKIRDIQKITFKPTKPVERYYTRATLLKILPRLVPGEDPYYGGDSYFQFGTIRLKDGTVLKWHVARDNTLVLESGTLTQLFVLPPKKLRKIHGK